MAYSETIIIRTCDCDMNGHWKPSAMLEAMQEVATSHCNGIGLGRDVTFPLGVVWVLSRCRVEFSRLPRIGEACAVETWAMPARHLFFPRAHAFRDAEGNVIGESCALWMLMDIKSRRAVAEPFVTEHMAVESRATSVKLSGAVRHVGGGIVSRELTPQYTDFDLNGHVNNTRYLDWCLNALGAEALAGRAIAAFDVAYDREVLPGEIIRTEMARDANAFSFFGYTGENARCFGVRGELRT